MTIAKNNSQTCDRWAAVSLGLCLVGALVFIGGLFAGAMICSFSPDFGEAYALGCNVICVSLLAGAILFSVAMLCIYIADKY